MSAPSASHNQRVAAAYDQVPYAFNAHPETHPINLAAIASLFNRQPIAVSKSRILEIGCGNGSNLLPIAEQFPKAELLGIDLSSAQIGNANRIAAAAKLPNIQFLQLDFADLGDSHGQFDFIIIHGVYSWIPADARETLLETIKARLTDNGVAYVSYNTLPGWNLKGIVRDMSLFHSRKYATPKDKIEQSKALITFVHDCAKGQDTPYSSLLEEEINSLKTQPDTYLFHEHLAETNDACYFQDFAKTAYAHGLQYIADVEIGSMMLELMKPEVAETLGRITSNVIAREQYMDFVRNRPFRRSLICKQEPLVDRNIKLDTLLKLQARSHVKPTASMPSLKDGVAEEFTDGPKKIMVVDSLCKAVLNELSKAAPSYLPLESAIERAKRSSHAARDAAGKPERMDVLLKTLFELYCHEHVHFVSDAPSCALYLSDHPKMSDLARIQATSGLPVINRYHRSCQLDFFGRQVAAILDGTRDQDAIIEALAKLSQAGKLNISESGKPVKDPKRLRQIIAYQLDLLLNNLAASALLIA